MLQTCPARREFPDPLTGPDLVNLAGTATGQGLAELAARTKKEPGIS